MAGQLYRVQLACGHYRNAIWPYANAAVRGERELDCYACGTTRPAKNAPATAR